MLFFWLACPGCGRNFDFHLGDYDFYRFLGPPHYVCPKCGTVYRSDRQEWAELSGIGKLLWLLCSALLAAGTGLLGGLSVMVARQFALNAEKTKGRSMVILGAGLNHWYHMDMNYRGIINMLVMCGCVGQSGGGWSHYVGQEKLRPQTGWTALAFALDWGRPPRHMNSTSAWYAHSDQWRYETLTVRELLSPTAPAGAELDGVSPAGRSVGPAWAPEARTSAPRLRARASS